MSVIGTIRLMTWSSQMAAGFTFTAQEWLLSTSVLNGLRLRRELEFPLLLPLASILTVFQGFFR